jgi:hypothetical protein
VDRARQLLEILTTAVLERARRTIRVHRRHVGLTMLLGTLIALLLAALGRSCACC